MRRRSEAAACGSGRRMCHPLSVEAYTTYAMRSAAVRAVRLRM